MVVPSHQPYFFFDLREFGQERGWLFLISPLLLDCIFSFDFSFLSVVSHSLVLFLIGIHSYSRAVCRYSDVRWCSSVPRVGVRLRLMVGLCW